jgi:hypothetical protein
MDKRIRYISHKLKLDLSQYFIYADVEILNQYLTFYFLTEKERSEKKILEDLNLEYLKAGNPVLFWEYDGPDYDDYKKQLISRTAIEELKKILARDLQRKAQEETQSTVDENFESGYRKLGPRKRNCCMILFCVGLQADEDPDMFEEE